MADEEKEDKKDNEEEKSESELGVDDLDSEEGEPKKSKKMLIIIIAAVLLLGGGGGAAFFLMGGDEAAHEPADGEANGELAEGEQGEESNHGDDKTAIGKAIYYDMPEFLVNLNTGGKGTSFLKAVVTLELPSQNAVTKVEDIKPRIIDSFNTYLRELRKSDLQGSAGIYRLREELLLRVNKAMYPDKVSDILFKEIIVQ